VIRKLQVPVIANTPLSAPGHYVLTFSAPELVQDARPGQFVAVAAGDACAQILRRPFSLLGVDRTRGQASLLYSAHGPTSQMLARCVPGDAVDLIGPLGRRVFAPDARPGARHVLVGGGYGVPPLVFLARTIKEADPGADVRFVSGARSRELLVGTEGLAEIGVMLRTCTEDGTCGGVHGRVTDALPDLLADRDRPACVYTCGPLPMMRAVAAMAAAAGAACQVSMEVFMPCGIGICMGCAVPRTDGTYARGCYEGPVFDAGEVAWA